MEWLNSLIIYPILTLLKMDKDYDCDIFENGNQDYANK